MIGKRLLLSLSLVASLTVLTGCPVGQPRGLGMYKLVQEPATKTWYHLYLPVDYVHNQGQHPDTNIKRWPLVMTFHGMKPYDNALPQEREWEQQADIYGYIVCAPQLETSDSFMEYPLTKEHSYVQRDKRNVIAVMDHVFATTLADPKRVLATSWSCGGYLAHYFPNRFPDRFSCIATRLSNFSSKLMLEETVPLYKDKIAVAVFIGDGDFPACKSESEEAVAWYTARHFRVVRGKMIDRMGHQRIPQTAAAFFAEQLDIKPLRPVDAARTLAWVQMTDYQPPQQLVARMSPPAAFAMRDSGYASRQVGPPAGGPNLPASPSKPRTSNYVAQSSGKSYPVGQAPAYDPTPEPPPVAKPKTEAAPSSPAGEKKDASVPSVPASGAGATRVAQASPRPGNVLEPTRPVPPKQNEAPAPVEAKPSSPAPVERPPAKSEAAKPRTEPAVDPGKQVQKAKPATAEPPPSPPPVRPPPREFTPKDAGYRHYDVASAQREVTPPRATPPPKAPPSPAPKETEATKPVLLTDASASPAGAARRTPSPSPHAPKPEQPSKSKSVTVKLTGPAIGRAPHWIGYSVDLPRSVTQGADFLWMDNGVWLNDEQSGVKILETPGRHEITVLMVGRNNEEYRGSAVVEVLDPYPSGRGSN
ncbi:MAG TPA: prolyl oligopeptidase family serine peptidase [Phycisphaerae bacterium]|nr:prolyl oligopeptidase family serine peptidase [Phycisphaerae bacterium]